MGCSLSNRCEKNGQHLPLRQVDREAEVTSLTVPNDGVLRRKTSILYGARDVAWHRSELFQRRTCGAEPLPQEGLWTSMNQVEKHCLGCAHDVRLRRTCLSDTCPSIGLSSASSVRLAFLRVRPRLNVTCEAMGSKARASKRS
jgi:hypothetical protein